MTLPTMLVDGKIDLFDTRLEQFKVNNLTHQNDLQIILAEYTQLLEDYKNLKRSYEKEIERPKSPSVSSNNGKRPYVFVLVDGNGYFFNDELIKEREEGGMQAARMLNSAIERYLYEALPAAANARIVVRVYCDLTYVSKVLAKSQLVGFEKRSLAAFTAGFTRALPLFDFIDAMDEEGTKFKIREAFKMAVEDTACSHILYAACCDPAYLSQLVAFNGMRNKITLIQAAGFNSDFYQFNFDITQFPTVFRWSEHAASKASKSTPSIERNGIVAKKSKTKYQDGNEPWSNGESWRKDHNKCESISGAKQSIPDQDKSVQENDDETESSWSSSPSKKPANSSATCKYFRKGFCRLGSNCGFAHDESTFGEDRKRPNGTIRGNISSILPSSTVPGFIAINKDGHRLDAYIPPPTAQEWVIYKSRFNKQKPCNAFYLSHVCNTTNCPFDHTELEPEALRALEYVVKCSPCPKRGECRSSECLLGHLCQKTNCTGTGKGCRMRPSVHNVDPKLHSMVPMEWGMESPPAKEDVEILVDTEGMW